MNLKKALAKDLVLLLLMSSVDYNESIVKVIRGLPSSSICYVTLNKTSDSLQELFKEKKVKTGQIFFVDAISKTIKSISDNSERVCYVSSPGNLTELSVALSQLLKRNFDYLIFDSLTNLLIYTHKAPVAKFVSSLINRIKATKTKALFYALNIKEQDELIKEVGMFVDKVINFENKKGSITL